VVASKLPCLIGFAAILGVIFFVEWRCGYGWPVVPLVTVPYNDTRRLGLTECPERFIFFHRAAVLLRKKIYAEKNTGRQTPGQYDKTMQQSTMTNDNNRRWQRPPQRHRENDSNFAASRPADGR
jgi:hypothetical protein